MKKLFFLSALLCASMMGFAINWNSYEWIGDGAGGGAYSNKYKIALDEGQAVVNIQKPGFADKAGIYTTVPAGVSSCSLGEGNYAVQGAGIVLYLDAFTNQETEVTIVHGLGSCVCTVYYVDGIPSETPGKADPELSLNETAVELSAEAPAQTFQIVPSQNGDGAISYESNKPGIASVDNTGLVTAVGRGTAVITVSVAETESHEADSKKLTVTVNGPINWAGLDWLYGSDNKYKLVTEPEIADSFGGKKIENSNLWIGFPSAVWGDNSSIEHTAVGAGVSFPLSQFPKIHNEFNFICDGTTYKIMLYYVDGDDTATAIDNVNANSKAVKVIENGVVYIIREGVKYNVLGAKQ